MTDDVTIENATLLTNGEGIDRLNISLALPVDHCTAAFDKYQRNITQHLNKTYGAIFVGSSGDPDKPGFIELTMPVKAPSNVLDLAEALKNQGLLNEGHLTLERVREKAKERLMQDFLHGVNQAASGASKPGRTSWQRVV